MRTGATIKNNLTGETITMLVGEEENSGAFQLWEARLPSRRIGPSLHYHVNFAETFTVIEGTLDFYLGQERRHILLNPKKVSQRKSVNSIRLRMSETRRLL